MEAELTSELKTRAHALGFAKVGVAGAEPLGVEAERLRAWLESGRHASMQWMKDTEAVRADPTHERMVEGARSVVVLVTPYARGHEHVGIGPGRVARYARGRDYHNVLGKRGRKLTKWLRSRGYEARFSVDSMPVFERAWAQRAGVGFIGKNTCLIVPGLGSHVFLSCLVTTAPLVVDSPIKERCGDCRACLDVCPTAALVDERELDARRCVSYLTIEHRGEIPVEYREGVGDWMLGCDACQDVCPYNRGALPEAGVTAEFAPHPRWDETSVERFLELGDDGFLEWAQGSPAKRAGYESLRRNLALVLGNTGEKRHLPVLRALAEDRRSTAVQGAARWAIARLGKPNGEPSER